LAHQIRFLDIVCLKVHFTNHPFFELTVAFAEVTTPHDSGFMEGTDLLCDWAGRSGLKGRPNPLLP